MLATCGIHIASEATFRRILKKYDLQQHRSRARPPTRQSGGVAGSGRI